MTPYLLCIVSDDLLCIVSDVGPFISGLSFNCSDMLIYKDAETETETPWHQDEVKKK